MKRILGISAALLVAGEAAAAWLRPGDPGLALAVAGAVALGFVGAATFWAIRPGGLGKE